MSLEALIKEKYPLLSPGQKKVAEYLLMKPEQAAFLTAVQLGREAEVSETTVIRLSYALGFNGFSDLQARLQQQILTHSGMAGQTLIPERPKEGEAPGLFHSVLERDIAIVRNLASTVNEADIWKAVDWLIEADQVVIAGYRASFGAAHWMSFMLSQCRGQVHLLGPAGEMPEKVSTLTEKSVALVLSYPRYSREAVQTAECVKRQGARLIAATDRPLSPVGQLADLTFTTEENHESWFTSVSGTLSFLNLLLIGVAEKDQARIRARSQKLEQLYAAYGVFVE